MLGRLSLVCAAIAIGVGCASIGQAAPRLADADVPSATVSLADLNLNSAAGAKAALSRIRIAARQLCGEEWSYRTLGAAVTWNACFQKAVSDGVTQVNRPLLTTLADATGRRSSHALGVR